jgi:farnesyl diphosphate synthase
MPTTLKEFESVWPRIRADLQDHCKQYKLPQQSLDWFTKVCTCHPNVLRVHRSRV